MVAYTNCSKSLLPQPNLIYSVALSLLPAFSVSPEQSLQSPSHWQCQCPCAHAAYEDVTIFTKRYSVNMTIFSKRYRQYTYVRTYVHQGRIEPPQCVVHSPHALALGNNHHHGASSASGIFLNEGHDFLSSQLQSIRESSLLFRIWSRKFFYSHYTLVKVCGFRLNRH